MPGSDDDALRLTERWFIRRGLPLFIAQYSSQRDIWTRAQPFLVLVLAVEFVPMVLIAFLPGGTVGPLVALGLALLAFGGFGLWSRLRRAFWFAPADRVGWPFLVFFVLAPPLAMSFIVGFEFDDGSGAVTNTWWDVGSTALTQLAFLAVVYVFARYAVIAMLMWGLRQTLRHSRDLYRVTTKALPLLLIVMIVLFVNTEMWQMAGGLDAGVLWASAGCLLFLGVLVTLDRTRSQIRSLAYAAAVEDVAAACRLTPLELVPRNVLAGADPVPLERRESGNLVVAAMATQMIQAALIGVVVWAFFVIFGVLAITEPLQAAWLMDLAPNDVFVTIGEDHVLSRALIRVATFLGAFAAFYTTIYAASDDTYRRSFATDVGSELQRAVNVRRVYHALREHPPHSPTQGASP